MHLCIVIHYRLTRHLWGKYTTAISKLAARELLRSSYVVILAFFHNSDKPLLTQWTVFLEVPMHHLPLLHFNE